MVTAFDHSKPMEERSKDARLAIEKLLEGKPGTRLPSYGALGGQFGLSMHRLKKILDPHVKGNRIHVTNKGMYIPADHNPPRNMSKTVRDAILKRIADGTYKPDTAIPSDIKLAEEFGGTRQGVRYALRALIRSGQLVTKPSIGTFVPARTSERPPGARKPERADR
ncbi:winged helix-turn-helix domain-containing protein [Streptomyces sp. NPDC002690]